MTTIIKSTILLFFCAFSCLAHAQIVAGKISYERKTNLYKKFKKDNVTDWLKEEDKNKLDEFELFFNDTATAFKPKESELKERLAWATSKNSVFLNFKSKTSLTQKSIWGEKLWVEDTLKQRKWKITDSKRKIAGLECRKAIWQANDSTRIYAWYTEEIIPSIGPESFFGLPGAILGLATEDGGVIYFAKSIEILQPDISQIHPPKIKDRKYQNAELKTKLEKQYSKYSWGKAMIRNEFGLW